MRPAAPASPLLLALLLVLSLAGCAAFSQRDPLNVQVAGIQPLPGEGLELRMDVKLRIQNPNDMALDYNGVALDLEVNGRRLASGVSDARGSVPRFGEAVLSVPMTISAFSAARQALGLAEHIGMDEVPYVLRGKLAGGLFGTQRFVEKGTLDLEGTLPSPYRRQ
ncbi:water stress/hypersensitive response domain-containing protein [Pseudomonas sp. SST3]|uniref:LEA type 2 family protein n=1 Tax=Pseudomonas sp. SST3 TaxID=2267882 RepID=UPI000DFC3853|nr:LEA type 2 family protein [Pseudomonas sp. SST3]NKQ09453.1 water stress/hypersensitive response domain-containing protein [Pseudomonas sp. SST3]